MKNKGLFSALALAFLWQPAIFAAQATAYQINAGHDGVTTSGGTLALQESPRWSKPFTSAISYPVIANGRVHVVSGNLLYALDPVTGQNVWGPTATVNPMGLTYDAGKLFVVSRGGLLSSFDAATGTPGWSVQLSQYSFSSAPTASNGVVYVGGSGGGGTLYAVNETNGTLLWSVGVANGDNSSPAVGPDGVYVSYACLVTYSFNKSTGAMNWVNPTGCSGGGGDTAVYAGGRVYARDGIYGPRIFDAATGNILGSFSYGPPPAIGSDTGFFLDQTGTLSAVDVATNAIKWRFAGSGTLQSAPIVVDDTVIVGSSTGIIYGLNTQSGNVTWQYTASAGIPSGTQYFNLASGLAVGEGILVVPTENSLLAFSIFGSPAPTGAAATGLAGAVRLDWNAAAGAATYNVYMGALPGAESVSPVLTGVTSTTATVTGLTPGQSYYFKVKAIATSGISAASNETSAVPHSPPAPGALTSAAGVASASLSWALSSEAQSYNVYMASTSGGQGLTPVQSGISGTTATVNSLTPGTSYYFTVKAVAYGALSAATNETTVVPTVAPPPDSVVATAGIGSVALSWPTVAGVSSYNVYMGTTSGGESATPVVATALVPSVIISGLTAGTRYYFYVRTVAGGVPGGPSIEASATVLPTPPPSGLSAAVGIGQVLLTWTSSVTATSYEIFAGSCPGGEGPNPIASVTATTVQIGAIAGGTTSCYVVRARGPAGLSVPSNEVSATALRYPGPTSVTVTPGVGELSLTWAASPSASQYDVYIGSTPGGQGLTPAQTVVATSTVVTGLSSANIYYVFVRARTPIGNSSPSAEVSSSPLSPPAPTNVNAVAATNQVTLTWSASAGATTYSVFMGTSAGAESTAAVQSGITGLSTIVPSLTAGTTYYFVIRAQTPNGISLASNEVSAAVPPNPAPPTTPSTPTTPSSTGGGGGGMDLLAVGMLTLLLMLRFVRRYQLVRRLASSVVTAVLSCVALTSLSGVASAAPNTWSSIGPEGGYIRGLEFHGGRSGSAYAISERTLYLSSNAGNTWRPSPQTFSDTLNALAVPAANGDQVYVFEGNHGLWRSTDGGQTFQFRGAVGGDCFVYALVASSDGSRLAASCSFAERLFISDDGGTTWTSRAPASIPYTPGSYFTALAFSPTNRDVIYAGRRGGGVFKSVDGGLNWTLVYSGPSDPLDFSIVIDPANAAHVFIVSVSTILQSPDGGANWFSIMGASGPSLALDASNPGRLYAGSPHNAALHSTDGGVVWQLKNTDDGLTCGWISFMRVNPFNSQQIVAAGDEGVCRSDDGGTTWKDSSAGINAARISRIRVAHDTTRRILVGLSPGPAFMATDPLGTWTRIDKQAFRSGGAPGGINSVEFDSSSPLTTWHMSPRTSPPLRTQNAGATWTSSFQSLAANDLAVQGPSSTLIAAQDGLFRSVDGGFSWNPLSLPAGFGAASTISVAPGNPQIAYAGAGYRGFGTRFGIIRSGDGGTTWALANTGIDTFVVNAIAVHPTNPQVVYAATTGGLYRSRDGGQGWTRLEPVLRGMIAADDVAIDPVHPEVIYATYGYAQRSVDGGDTWEPLDIVPLNAVPSDMKHLAVDWLDPNIVYGGALARGLHMLDIAPDLELVATAQAVDIPEGGAGRVTYQVRNNGRFTATDVTLSVTRSALGGTLTVQTSRGTCTTGTSGFSCQLPRLGPAEIMVITADFRNATGPFTVNASVSAREHDSATANNTSQSSLSPSLRADVSSQISISTSTVTAGNTVTANAVITNNGPFAALDTGAVVDFGTLLGNGAVQTPRGSCLAAGVTVRCGLGTLAAGESVTLVVTASSLTVGSATISVQSSTTSIDADPANNSRSAVVTIQAPPAPTNVSAVAGTNQVTLSWSASAGATGYSVFMGTSPGSESATATQTGVSGLSTVVSGLNAGTTYYFVVKAQTPNGISLASNEASAAVPANPAPPTTPSTPGTTGGGGGSLDLLAIGTLALLWALGQRPARSSALPDR